MRTLDEVIKAVEEDLECANVSYPETFYDYDNHKDALHYLKEYQAILPLMPSLINMAIAVQKKGKTIG